MARNIVICLDGTANEPERVSTNVRRTYEIAEKSETQLVYYDPGVGTMGARSASTRIGQAMSRFNGLALGHGVKENIEEAYLYLMGAYQPGDQIYLFGFSRGAYTARALAGLLRSVGLLRPGLENLVPYAMKLYVRQGPGDEDEAANKEYWKGFGDFHDSFGNPDFPHPFNPHASQIHFLGVWDTVKFVGWLNVKGRFQQARWPFTRKISNVEIARHALALDERRRYYADYRFDEGEVDDPARDVEELWFVGVHSDVGGGLSAEQPLADLSLEWMLGEATTAGLRVDKKLYKRHLGVAPGVSLAPTEDTTAISHNKRVWWFAGAGWRRRGVRANDRAHASVAQWQAVHASYRPEL